VNSIQKPRSVAWRPRLGVAAVAISAVIPAAAPGLATAAAVSAAPTPPADVTRPGSSTGPLLTEAAREYTTMVATRYQHHNEESEVRHTYFYDCVGFVSYAMTQAAPTAWASTRGFVKLRPGYVPSPARYVALFDKVDAGASLAGWAAVPTVTSLQPGDVIAWYYDANATSKPGSASGHAVVVAGPVSQTGPGTYSLLVYDSTATPHGPNDTRLTNPANQPDAGGKPSGLGRGTIGILATPGGQISAVQWSAGGRSVRSAHYGMGRPVS